MKMLRVCAMWVCGWALVAGGLTAPAQTMSAAAPAKAPYYIDPTVMDLPALIPDPPPAGSAANNAELAELHTIESKRTPAQAAAAKKDEGEENLFLYETVLGPRFNAESLPITAALGSHVKNEQSVAGAALKAIFHRVRPYNTDKTLRPVCELTDQPNSYPSGHALTGYLEGLTLAEIVPEKREAILARADEYAHSRLVCGVHYPSDVEASRKVAYVVFGYMLATPRFQRDLAAARAETRAALDLASK